MNCLDLMELLGLYGTPRRQDDQPKRATDTGYLLTISEQKYQQELRNAYTEGLKEGRKHE